MYKKYAELRDKRNITDYRVAADTGISTATLSNWKNGNYAPKFDKLLIRMRFYESDTLEHIGFDFYCDIANNIVKARKEKGITQKELAKLAGIKEHRLVGIENVKIRIDLDDLEKLAKVFERTGLWRREVQVFNLARFYSRLQTLHGCDEQKNGFFTI